MNIAIETLARLLPPEDREAALGDLQEQGQDAWASLFAILGFAARQQMELWRSWHPWAAGLFVIAATLQLLGASFRIYGSARSLWQGGEGAVALFHLALLTCAWAWAGGFVLGSLWRRIGWTIPLLFLAPCASCLLEFRGPAWGGLGLLLFIPPALLGAVAGRRRQRLKLPLALVLMIVTIGAMLLWPGLPAANWLLALPAFYVAWLSAAPSSGSRGRSS